jgi:hypothetical protein
MPTDFSSEELDRVEREEGGKGLRQRLEDALRENRTISQELAQRRSREVISEQGLSLVKPEDLEGLSADELEEKAQAIQLERSEAQVQLARDVFAKKGLDGDELDAAVREFLSVEEGIDDDPYQRVRQVTQAGGQVVPAVNEQKLHGIDAIKAGLKPVK